MRIITLHCDYIKYFPKIQATKIKDEIEKKWYEFKNVLVCLIAIEENDNEEKIEIAKKEILQIFNNVKPERIVLYPFVHLTNKPAKLENAFELVKKLENELKKEVETYRAPFGWYKEFEIHVKGHPLAELSRTI